jgi:hypothetical protein
MKMITARNNKPIRMMVNVVPDIANMGVPLAIDVNIVLSFQYE